MCFDFCSSHRTGNSCWWQPKGDRSQGGQHHRQRSLSVDFCPAILQLQLITYTALNSFKMSKTECVSDRRYDALHLQRRCTFARSLFLTFRILSFHSYSRPPILALARVSYYDDHPSSPPTPKDMSLEAIDSSHSQCLPSAESTWRVLFYALSSVESRAALALR